MEFFKSPQFSSQVEDLMAQYHVPGLAIAIVHNEETASAGYGKASLEPEIPCTADTLFDVASSAKSLTAASVGLLVDDTENFPEVQYHTAMSSLLPDDFVMPGVGYTEGVTIDDVLGHRTGMAPHDNSYLSPRATQPDDARSITRNLRNLPVVAPLRSRYLYNNMMYTAATHLVEVKSGQSFAEFLTDRLFQPLGMASTYLQPKSAREKGLGGQMATGYHWDHSKYMGFQSQDCPEGQGAGSIITSVNDFILWVKALMNREGPINERIYQGLTRLRSFPNPSGRRLKPYTSPTIYTAGMEIYNYRGYAVVGHDGAITGFGSRFFFLPDIKFGGFIAGNSAGTGSIATTLVRQLIDEVLGVPAEERSGPNKSKKAQSAKPAGQAKKDGNKAKKTTDQTKKNANEAGKNANQIKKSDQVKDNGRGEEKAKAEKKQPPAHRPRAKSPPQQETLLTAYIGDYHHPGYHTLTVQVKEDQLFIDATDRSMGYTLTFEHISDQTKYTAHLSDFEEGGDDPFPAEFVLEDGKAIKMGLEIEMALKEMIWFERVA